VVFRDEVSVAEVGLEFFAAERARMVEDLASLVGRESPSDDAARVSALADWIAGRFRARGVHALVRPCAPRGDAVLAAVGAGRGGTLLLGHIDTVWPVGSWGADPFRIDGDLARGPGVFDMKAGIAVGMAVLGGLALEPKPPRVSMLLVPDEEVGTEASRALLLETARDHERVLVLEPSLEGAAKVARKGTGLFRIAFTGKAAHAGLEPEKGASALIEMARQALAVEGLSDPALETTVTATLARAGSVSNVVPESAELTADVRVWTEAEARRVESAFRGLKPYGPRVSLEVRGGFDRPPLEPTPAADHLYESARRVAADLGFDLVAARVGGASDGNLTAAAGIPTLDGLGPRGGGAHSRDERVVISDLSWRAAFLLRLVVEGLA
jgi:glutamate carboxypeptidase